MKNNNSKNNTYNNNNQNYLNGNCSAGYEMLIFIK